MNPGLRQAVPDQVVRKETGLVDDRRQGREGERLEDRGLAGAVVAEQEVDVGRVERTGGRAGAASAPLIGPRTSKE
ncbi:MAG TPA: hypothetical protein VGG20_20515, partial [Thermoanaerobaculia bacterium]